MRNYGVSFSCQRGFSPLGEMSRSEKGGKSPKGDTIIPNSSLNTNIVL